MDPEAIPFLKKEDDASAAAEAPEGPPADNEGDEGPPVGDENEPAPGAEVAVDPADGNGPPPTPAAHAAAGRAAPPGRQLRSRAKRAKKGE